jgi:hypothetical protein
VQKGLKDNAMIGMRGKFPSAKSKLAEVGTSGDLTSSSADHRRMTSEIHLVCTAEDIITEIAVVV